MRVVYPPMNSPSDPPDSERVLLPSYRLGVLHHKEPDGRSVFLDQDGKLCCEHGCRADAIRKRLYRKPAGDQDEPTDNGNGSGGDPSDPSEREGDLACSCTSLNGLYVKVFRDPPPRPPSLYDLLRATDAPSVTVRHPLPALELPFHRGTFLRADGRLVCRHGRTRRSKKKGAVGCDCAVACVSIRKPSMPLGRPPKENTRVHPE